MTNFTQANQIPAFCPEIAFALNNGTGGLKQGRDYDMVVSESVSHSNEVATHPIEDPKKSFLIDHNRENPIELSLTMIVSTIPSDKLEKSGIDRIRAVQDALLAMRALQTVDVKAFVTVYTGIKTYSNMGIRSLDFTREPETPNTMQIEIGFFEYRVAKSPRLDNESWLMNANNGALDPKHQPITLDYDRPIVEATVRRRRPRMSFPLPSQEIIIRTALRKLGVPQLRALDILAPTGTLPEID
jgi:hypothetical protein